MQTKTKLRASFFDYLFGDNTGYLCIATSNPDMEGWINRYFSWPDEKVVALAYIEKRINRHNVYFCTSLLETKERKKIHCLPGNLLWGDLDACRPDLVEPSPSVVLESSPGRYHALWRLDRTIPTDIAEQYSKRLAYKYSPNGADKTGWDLGQLLRVPFTYNYKYEIPGEPVPEVLLLEANDDLYDPDVFEKIEVEALKEEDDESYDTAMPELDKLVDPAWPIYRVQEHLSKTPFADLYTRVPEKSEDWSALLWKLINICLESDMTLEETFAVAINSKCNKYARDGRPPRYLWQEIQKAYLHQTRLNIITNTVSVLTMPLLVEPEDGTECWLDEYKKWGTLATDAPPEYHELAGAIALSVIAANAIRLPTSHIPLVPNLWGMILGDSSLARKSTAMKLALALITEIDLEYLLATEGSAEGLLTGLATRPNRTSLFYRDEISGFFESINKKDYLAGMPELLTELYDTPPMLVKRLRKETFTITNPVFIFFGGGIKDKVHELLNEQYIMSGFLPRFLVVSGAADLSRIRPTGPPTPQIDKGRTAIRAKLHQLHETYNQLVPAKIGSQTVQVNATFEAQMTDSAWELFGKMEHTLMTTAHESNISILAMPTLIRLGFSTLKLACLLAATHTEPDKNRKLVVSETDLINAAKFTQRWGVHSIDLLHNTGKSVTERTLDRIKRTIERQPGIARRDIMRHHRLMSRDADLILDTLEQRGFIYKRKEGRGYRVWPIQ